MENLNSDDSARSVLEISDEKIIEVVQSRISFQIGDITKSMVKFINFFLTMN